ncbi:MFS transporter [Isoptericola sp. BMS4]|uniref:MFS transporter n=1 Tax=Isoptericola sp. BMS4 TaxID=2527875 RepID=UPI00196AB2B3|nr:MFS transporter [Isoptericola sp. BMS4]
MEHTVLWVACVAQVLVVLDASVLNVALPAIRDELTLTDSGTSWVALAYTLGFAGTILAGARLGDVVGAGRALVWGIGAFTAAGVLGGVAPDGGVLTAARAVQGVSAAVVSPATFALLTIWFAEGPPRVRAMAIWTGASLAGGGVGNVLSGVLTEYVSWRAVLLVNLPIGLVVLVGSRRLVRRRETVRGRVDALGSMLVVGAFTAVTYAVSRLGDGGAVREVVPSVAVGAALFVALALQQRAASERLVPLRLWLNRTVLTGNAATLLAGTCLQVSVWYFLTFLMQEGMGFSAAATGLGFVPLTVVMLAVTTWGTPWLLRRCSVRALVAAGSGIAALGFLVQGLVPVTSYPVTVLVPSLLVGTGGGLLGTPLAAAVTHGVGGRDAGAAAGLMNTAKQFGGAIGLAALVALPAPPGGQEAFLVMAGLIATAGLVGLFLPTERRSMQPPP